MTPAGIERADVFVASTNGDNTNIVIAQLAKRRFNVPTVIARILDPLRAEWYDRQGVHTICPTKIAIEMLETEVRDAGEARGRLGAEGGLGRPRGRRDLDGATLQMMYVIVVGAGKVGWNIARELLEKGHEVTLIENDRERYQTVEQELEHNIQYGDASELWVLERAGVQRADMVIAVTGDDEDNMLICQVAKEKYLVDRIIARVNNPRNREHFELLGDSPGGVRDGPDYSPDRARGARVRARASARSARAAPRDHRDAPAGGLAGDRAAGWRSARFPTGRS